MRQRERHVSVGNACLLLIVDSAGPYWERSIVDETVLVALEHFGMPYRVLDLAHARPSPESLENCAAIVLAQNRVGGSLSRDEAAAIEAAVRRGVGFVNLDYDIRELRDPLPGVFGFGRINPHPYMTDTVRIRDTDHDIAALQSPGEWHRLDRMVTAIAAEQWGDDVVPLADGVLGRDQLVAIRHLAPWSAFEPRNYPVLFVTRLGEGRAVQFTLNLRVWRKAFLGHARGMDDLLWRSIVWAARKPFATNMVPPFVTMSFDDCEGRHDFAYADIACRHGFVPMPSLLVRNVPDRLHPGIREGLASKGIRFSAHALDYYRLLVYNFGKGECSEAELKANFAEMDGFWAQVGAEPGPTLRFHWGEYGVRALPHLKRRGYRYFCPGLQMGLHKADMCMDDGYWPYGLQTCYYDSLPDDPDFFAFAAMLARHQEDFLTGCTVYLKESDRNDIEKAASNAALQIRHGLRAGFYAEIVTHEQKFDGLSMAEWDQILARANEMTAGLEQIRTGHDEIGQYLKGKDGVWIARGNAADGRLRCRMRGSTETPLRLSVFRDADDGVTREYLPVDAFDGEIEIG